VILDARVVAQPVHHHLAHHRPDAVPLGGPESGIQAGLVDRPVEHHRRAACGGEGTARGRCQALGGGFVEVALEREDVTLEPGQQVQPGAQPGIR
jgi:hypothetical protein